MSISFRPIAIENGSEHEALLVLNENYALIGVLVKLSDDYEEPELPGCWFLEVGFGHYEAKGEVFCNLDAARDWFQSRRDDSDA